MSKNDVEKAESSLQDALASIFSGPDPDAPTAPGTVMCFFEASISDGTLVQYAMVGTAGRLMFLPRKPTVQQKELLSAKEDDTSPLKKATKNHYEFMKKAKPGHRFLMSQAEMFLCTLPEGMYEPTGPIMILGEDLGDGLFLPQTPKMGGMSMGMSAAIFVAEGDRAKYKTGDRVMIEGSSNRVMKLLPPEPKDKSEEIKKLVIESTNVSWDDIGGLDDVRTWFEETFSTPLEHPELYARYGLKLPKGALLAGPPGNGKSLLAKALANDVAKKHNKPGGFIAVNGPELLNCFVGETESRIRDVFEQANAYYAEHKIPPVVFFDEAEALFSRRGTGRSSDMEKTIVPTFLTMVDGMKGTNAFLLLATNRPDTLDPAVIREGRIDRKLIVPRPTKEAARQIFKVHTKKLPGVNEALLDYSVDTLFKPELVLATATTESGELPVTLGDLSSGAMIAALCLEAARSALKRDIISNAKTPSGLTTNDMKEAIRKQYRSTAAIENEYDIKELIESKGKKLKSLKKMALK